MQDIRWKAFWLILSLTAFCLLIWLVYDTKTALIIFSVGILIYLAGHLYWLHKLYTWLLKPVLNHIPNGTGIWEDVFAMLYQEQRKHSRNQSQLSTALERFRHATSALPDAVVVLNTQNEIEWFNDPAEKQLGLNKHHDEKQPINYLVRNGEFLSYLQSDDYSSPIKLKSWRNPDVTLEIQLIPFGTKQKLLICRDISALEKTEVMRRDFIANVSHELRTPLTVIGGFLETLSDMAGEVSETAKPYFNMMQEQTGRMRRIIEDLLTLSQIESNAKDTEDIEIDMSNMLKLVQNDAKGLSQSHHKIHLETDPTLNLNGAQSELQSAFSNLVSNAIRYTPKGGEIYISWGMHDGQPVFSVRDTGIGIEQHHIDRLTERFYRVDSSRSRETGGTGLGLSIVKHILNRHQANLHIESEVGVGSTFSIVFPKSRMLHKQVSLFA
ncbi:phosphate regulon sensor kinase PhoR [Methylophilaceae bacterium 11]|uniref:phosphate regulon sensor histidine kinase PhoR n=1 Tax=unclassified Methylotenera TaxID=2643294 RepID=UPI000371B6A6|nr:MULTISPECIES: phosphate regulon sensor histidine kinase PhoR [unclassified Methylotenera]EUJ11379.1 phosphate regulon sensor kinase PhoR [Methylophilaceae bacterium 11]